MKIDGLRVRISIELTFAILCIILAISFSLELIEPESNVRLSALTMLLSGYILCDHVKTLRRRYEDEDQNEDRE